MHPDKPALHDAHLRTMAERIFDDAHKIILKYAPMVNRETILRYPQGKKVIDEIVEEIYRTLRREGL